MTSGLYHETECPKLLGTSTLRLVLYDLSMPFVGSRSPKARCCSWGYAIAPGTILKMGWGLGGT